MNFEQQKYTNEEKELLNSILEQYSLLEKLPVDINFYNEFYKYRELAEKINLFLDIDIKENHIEFQDSFTGYILTKVIFLIRMMHSEATKIFKNLSNEKSEILQVLESDFIKLAQIGCGDIHIPEYNKLLIKIQSHYFDFWHNTELTIYGKSLNEIYNLVGLVEEVDEVKINIHLKRDSNRPLIKKMIDFDLKLLITRLNKSISKVIIVNGKKEKFLVKNFKEKKYEYLYANKNLILKKEILMYPVHSFQTLLKIKLSSENTYNDSPSNNREDILKVENKKILLEMTYSDIDVFFYHLRINKESWFGLEAKEMWENLYNIIEKKTIDSSTNANLVSNINHQKNTLKNKLSTIGYTGKILKSKNGVISLAEGISGKIVDYSKTEIKHITNGN